VVQIKPFLQEKSYSTNELIPLVKRVGEDRLVRAIQWLLDNDKITSDQEGQLKWKK